MWQFRQKIEQNADYDSKINIFYSVETPGSPSEKNIYK